VGGQRAYHRIPALVTAGADFGQQRLQVVDHDQQSALLKQLGQPGHERRQPFRRRQSINHLKARKVPLQRQRELGQRPVGRHALVRGFVPDKPVERILVSVGEFQRARRLPAARHPMQQHARNAAAYCQRGA